MKAETNRITKDYRAPIESLVDAGIMHNVSVLYVKNRLGNDYQISIDKTPSTFFAVGTA